MGTRLFGAETEYGFATLWRVSDDHLVRGIEGDVIRTAGRLFPSVPAHRGSGRFFSNGCRLYIDHGMHPELCTPECTTPWEVVRYIKAGERMLAKVAVELQRKEPNSRALFFSCNVDYSGAHVTWGCHESYLHRTEPIRLRTQLVPHLVSRIIFTGAGGFDPRLEAPAFSLAPRVVHLDKVVSHDSTANRGIVHTKDEPLAPRGYHRLHIICGESLCSELATWLRFGTTALAVAMIEQGLNCGSGVYLQDPLEAMRTFAGDESCSATVPLSVGRRLSAIAIQEHYLAQAERHANAPFMPAWAPEVCRKWRAVLDDLGRGPAAVSRSLDWGIKRALFQAHTRRHGLEWAALGNWARILAGIRRGSGFLQPPVSMGRLEQIPGAAPAMPQQRATVMRATSARLKEPSRVEQLGHQLCELDLRFGEVGEESIFAALDNSGTLTHRVEGVGDIDAAMLEPPTGSRARIRGEAIRKLAGEPDRCRAEWQVIVDRQARRVLRLTDPFEAEERWINVTAAGDAGPLDDFDFDEAEPLVNTR